MSEETSQWLNENTLIGFTEKRGNAWHYRAADQGEESNHYPGAIPIEDVTRRLFHWTAVEMPLWVGNMVSGDDIKLIEDRKAIVTSDTNEVLGIFKSGYTPHQYNESLINNVATILDDTLAISSAGQLKNRAIAWVEVSVPETIKTPSGVDFRPNLLACTSFDGSLSTTYKRTVQLTVCDNTMAAALGEEGQQIKIRHSSRSALRITDAREALAVVYETADDFTREVEEMTNQAVADYQWEQILNKLVPVAEEGKGSKRAVTTATAKREQLQTLYDNDNRVSPWRGTAFGVLQAFNTWNHHYMPTRSATIRAERNMLNAVSGETDNQDRKVLSAIGAL